ncbi:MAG TPA: hypothetical protein VMY98_02600 [Anaerolineae bacterium]|nr:hypothetical protein [Anaerolineae bacterium]
MLFAEWRLVFTGAADGYVNMAIDEATLVLVGEGRVPPTVRVYRWDRPCYTVGYLQRISTHSRAMLRGGACIRRLTGGQACLHGGDLSYSIVVSLVDTLIPSDVIASYERISFGVIEGLRLLGVDARYAPPAAIRVDEHTIGTAGQARQRGVLLHQGTIALKSCGIDGAPVLPCETLVPLSDVAGGETGFSNVAEALAMGFERALGVDLSRSGLYAKEKRLARQLLREKYKRSEWNLAHLEQP